MAHVAQAQPGFELKLDELKIRLKSFGNTLFSKLVEARMETARYRLAAVTSERRDYDDKKSRR